MYLITLRFFVERFDNLKKMQDKKETTLKLTKAFKMLKARIYNQRIIFH